MIEHVVEKEKCIGCALCESICPKGAISMKIVDGFYRPSISANCVSCGICIKNCPINHKELIEKNKTPSFAYAAWSKDDSTHFRSSSGGLCFEIARSFIIEGGVVIGVWFNPQTGKVEHRVYDNVDNLHCMQGSKYVNSNKLLIYKKGLEYLKTKNVLFIGVPCETNAMKRLAKVHDLSQNLFLIDLLCRGGSSPKCFQEHYKAVSFGRKVENVSFRGGKNDCNFVVYGKKREIYVSNQFVDPYFHCFMKRSIYQRGCYECLFAGAERVGDITLGDFWVNDEDALPKSEIRGTNMVFVNTEKGSQILNKVADKIYFEVENTDLAISGNDTLREPTPIPSEYDNLWLSIKKQGFHKGIKKVYGISWLKIYLRNTSIIRSLIKKAVYIKHNIIIKKR